jgi:hypothetical protein
MEAPLILLLALVLFAHGAAAKPQKKVDPPPSVVLEVTCGDLHLWLRKNDKGGSFIKGWDFIKGEGLPPGEFPVTFDDEGNLYINGKKCGPTKDLSKRPAKQAPPPTTLPVPSIKIELSCTSENAPDLKEIRVAYEAKNGQSTYFYPVYVTKDGTSFGVIDNYRRTYQIDLVGGTAEFDYLMSYSWFGEHKQKPQMKLHYKLTLFADHTATLADEHIGVDKIVYKCTEVHQ